MKKWLDEKNLSKEEREDAVAIFWIVLLVIAGLSMRAVYFMASCL